MGNPTGFLEIARQDRPYHKVAARLRNWQEFVLPLPHAETRQQAARCMDCGIPFCHNGCPVNNIIPDFNNLVYQDDWKQALDVLHTTNNFPEFTGRICPAPCEAACVLNIGGDPVGIKSIELAIIERGWKEGWVVPQPSHRQTGKKVAVVGSGPTLSILSLISTGLPASGPLRPAASTRRACSCQVGSIAITDWICGSRRRMRSTASAAACSTGPP